MPSAAYMWRLQHVKPPTHCRVAVRLLSAPAELPPHTCKPCPSAAAPCAACRALQGPDSLVVLRFFLGQGSKVSRRRMVRGNHEDGTLSIWSRLR